VTLLYTGVRKDDARLRAGAFHDLQTVAQVQLAAVPRRGGGGEGAGDLVVWDKVPGFVVEPPAALRDRLVGFRDPFVVQTEGTARLAEKHIVVGGGLRGEGGTALVYTARDVCGEWKFRGPLCSDKSGVTGPIWECPFVVGVPVEGAAAAGGGGTVDVLSVGHFPPDTTRTHVWLGRYDADAFSYDIDSAAGPYLVDHGDAAYAPTCYVDGVGRVVLYGWVMERPGADTGRSAGCMTVPRVLSAVRGAPDGRLRLRQAPHPGLAGLREGPGWALPGPRVLAAGESVPLAPGVRGGAFEVELALRDPGGAGGGGVVELMVAGAAEAATVAVDTRGRTATFGVSPAGQRGDKACPCEPDAGGTLRVRVFVDASCVEVFCGATGQVITRRVHPGGGGLAFAVRHCGGSGSVEVTAATLWKMGSIWA